MFASTNPTLYPDYRRRYYFDKFGFLVDTPEGVIELQKLVSNYIEGIIWCLGYYTMGCRSWKWYYPYNFGPFLQDVINISGLTSKYQFELGRPFEPFQQVLIALPAFLILSCLPFFSFLSFISFLFFLFLFFSLSNSLAVSFSV